MGQQHLKPVFIFLCPKKFPQNLIFTMILIFVKILDQKSYWISRIAYWYRYISSSNISCQKWLIVLTIELKSTEKNSPCTTVNPRDKALRQASNILNLYPSTSYIVWESKLASFLYPGTLAEIFTKMTFLQQEILWFRKKSSPAS